jgi:hypothetical protein
MHEKAIVSENPNAFTSVVDPDPGGQKMAQKNRKQLINFILWSAGCSLLSFEGWRLLL